MALTKISNSSQFLYKLVRKNATVREQSLKQVGLFDLIQPGSIH